MPRRQGRRRRRRDRELANTIALSDPARSAPEQLDEPAASPTIATNLGAQVEAFERGLMEQALRPAAGNHSEAARRLGMSRVTLLDKLKRTA